MFSVKKLSGAIGAELAGVDLTNNLSEEILVSINEHLVKHEVVFFRDQDISWEQHVKLGKFFGPLQSHPAYNSPPNYPEITILESTKDNPSKIECWHTDMTFLKNPPLCSILRSKICPSKGGDTMWSSMTAAYESLSESMKNFLKNLTAEHDFCHGFKESIAEPGGRERLKDAIKNNPPVIHPVIRTHPITKRKAIFVNPLFTTKINELSKSESDALLEFLYSYSITPEFTCRFSWTPNSIAIWDNRCTFHKPINDYFPEHRLLERITVDGDEPF